MNQSVPQHRRGRTRRSRRGASTVEFALVAPLLFFFFFGAIEFARVNQVCNATAFAAYQGCRRAIVPGATAANATEAAEQVLNANLINNASITINPANITNTTETVSVTVAVSLNNNTWIAPMYSQGMIVVRTCTLTREKTN